MVILTLLAVNKLVKLIYIAWIIIKMNLSKLNLNLLTALDALLTEVNVTQAGKKIFITQSAMSNLLKQLREVFADPLLVRGMASSMVLTPRAQALKLPVKEVLAKASAVFATPAAFNPQTAQRTFTIGMPDYIELILLPSLVQQLLETAPNIDIIVKHANFINESHIKNMEDDKLDLIIGLQPDIMKKDQSDIFIGLQPEIPEPLIVEELFEDYPVCAGWSKNPLLKKPLTVKGYAEAPHILVLFAETKEQSYSERILKKYGYHRRNVVTLPHTTAALQALPHTPLIVTVMKQVAQRIAVGLDVRFQPSPLKYPKIMVTQAWHPKNSNDPAHIWLRNIIKKSVTATIQQ